jgi:hypothetical protein
VTTKRKTARRTGSKERRRSYDIDPKAYGNSGFEFRLISQSRSRNGGCLPPFARDGYAP